MDSPRHEERSRMHICHLPSTVLARIFALVPDEYQRREWLPLVCSEFAEAAQDILWGAVRVDDHQYRRCNGNQPLQWEFARPWLAKRACNISGIDLRLSDSCNHKIQSVPENGVPALLRLLPHLKDLTMYLHKPYEHYDETTPEGEAAFVSETLAGLALPPAPAPEEPQPALPPGAADFMGGGPMEDGEDDWDDEPPDDEDMPLAPPDMPPGAAGDLPGDLPDGEGEGDASDSDADVEAEGEEVGLAVDGGAAGVAGAAAAPEGEQPAEGNALPQQQQPPPQPLQQQQQPGAAVEAAEPPNTDVPADALAAADPAGAAVEAAADATEEAGPSSGPGDAAADSAGSGSQGGDVSVGNAAMAAEETQAAEHAFPGQDAQLSAAADLQAQEAASPAAVPEFQPQQAAEQQHAQQAADDAAGPGQDAAGAAGAAADPGSANLAGGQQELAADAVQQAAQPAADVDMADADAAPEDDVQAAEELLAQPAPPQAAQQQPADEPAGPGHVDGQAADMEADVEAAAQQAAEVAIAAAEQVGQQEGQADGQAALDVVTAAEQGAEAAAAAEQPAQQPAGGEMPAADEDAELPAPPQAAAMAPPPHYHAYMPPPPLGLTMLGPEAFASIGDIRSLCRLDLDISVRSASLALAGLQIIGGLTNLEELYYECKVLSRRSRLREPFPAALLQLTGLRALAINVSGGHVALPILAGPMPRDITAMTRLSSLSLSAPLVPARRLPDGFGALPLASLVLWGCRLTDEDALQELGALTRLEMLSLANCALRSFPSEIKNLNRLNYVDIGHNWRVPAALQAAPADLLTNLTNLVTLQLGRTDFNEEPACIAEMPLLRGSTGAPLPAEYAAAEVAAAEADMAAAAAAASLDDGKGCPSEGADGGSPTGAAQDAAQGDQDDLDDAMMAAAIAASMQEAPGGGGGEVPAPQNAAADAPAADESAAVQPPDSAAAGAAGGAAGTAAAGDEDAALEAAAMAPGGGAEAKPATQ